ncbi:MAG: Rab family GTPase [Candidatus Thorarchaeota archaeon]
MILKKYDLLFRICIFADNNVGKKLLTNKFLKCKDDKRLDTSSILGIKFNIKDIEINSKIIRLMIWEWSLENEIKKLIPYFLERTNGVLFLYDITNTETLYKLTEWAAMIKENIKEGIPMLLVGNKLDLEENREVSEEQVEKFKEDYNISSSIEISAKTGENVEEMFKELTRMILNSPDVIKRLKE